VHSGCGLEMTMGDAAANYQVFHTIHSTLVAMGFLVCISWVTFSIPDSWDGSWSPEVGWHVTPYPQKTIAAALGKGFGCGG
jgi:hypothetical protein